MASFVLLSVMLTLAKLKSNVHCTHKPHTSLRWLDLSEIKHGYKRSGMLHCTHSKGEFMASTYYQVITISEWMGT